MAITSTRPKGHRNIHFILLFGLLEFSLTRLEGEVYGMIYVRSVKVLLNVCFILMRV